MSLGKKYTCFKCKTKFYDMGKAEPLCPKCGADQRDDPNPDPQEILLSKYKRPSSASEGSSRPPKKGAVGDDEEEEEFDEDVIEDAEPGFDDEDEDFGDFEEEPEEPEEEDYD